MLTKKQARTLIGSFTKEFANYAELEPVDASVLQIRLEAFVMRLDIDPRLRAELVQKDQVIAQQNASCLQAGFDREMREQLQIKVVDYELQIGLLAELFTQKYPEYGLQGGQGGAVDTAISTIEQLRAENDRLTQELRKTLTRGSL